MTEKIVPILPCQNIHDTVAFYEALGFSQTYFQGSPYAFAALAYGALELNFHQDKKLNPEGNANWSGHFMVVADVDAVYETFSAGFKKHLGKVPRSGKPMISKPRDLAEDRRFTFYDPNGNYFFVGTPIADNFFRTIASKEHGDHFKLLYDLMYSKEDIKAAAKMLEKFFPDDLLSLELKDIDLGKVILLAWDVSQQNNVALEGWLQEKFKQKGAWNKLKSRYEELQSS